MRDRFRLFIVSTGKAKPGKADDLAKWFRDGGISSWEALPRTRGVDVYGVQFGLGGEFGIEIWSEVEDYATFDLTDQELLDNPEKYSWFGELSELMDWGPTRIMGDFPASRLTLSDD